MAMMPPPGWERRAIEEYRPAGCPAPGSIWYRGPGGAATAICQDEDEAIARAWALDEKLRRPVQLSFLMELV